jgi:hypothetical protein
LVLKGYGGDVMTLPPISSFRGSTPGGDPSGVAGCSSPPSVGAGQVANGPASAVTNPSVVPVVTTLSGAACYPGVPQPHSSSQTGDALGKALASVSPKYTSTYFLVFIVIKTIAFFFHHSLCSFLFLLFWLTSCD